MHIKPWTEVTSGGGTVCVSMCVCVQMCVCVGEVAGEAVKWKLTCLIPSDSFCLNILQDNI